MEWDTSDIHYLMTGEWPEPPEGLSVLMDDIIVDVEAEDYDTFRRLAKTINIGPGWFPESWVKSYTRMTFTEYLHYLKTECDAFDLKDF